MITEVIFLYNVKFDISFDIHFVFYINLIYIIVIDPFLSQQQDDKQPISTMVNDNQKWEVDEFLYVCWKMI